MVMGEVASELVGVVVQAFWGFWLWIGVGWGSLSGEENVNFFFLLWFLI